MFWTFKPEDFLKIPVLDKMLTFFPSPPSGERVG